VKVKLEIDLEFLWQLLTYLYSHEHDIATSFDDFGELTEVFKELFGRSAKEDSK